VAATVPAVQPLARAVANAERWTLGGAEQRNRNRALAGDNLLLICIGWVAQEAPLAAGA